MPDDDLTATTPGVHCASWPSNRVLPIAADVADEPRPPNADHMHGRGPNATIGSWFCNGRLVAANPAQLAHDQVRRTLRDLGNGDAWRWCNNVAAPDPTTDAYLHAVRALEDLRRHLVQDAAELAYQEATP